MKSLLTQIRHLFPVLLLLALPAFTYGQDNPQTPDQTPAQTPATEATSGAPPAASGPGDVNLENPPLSGLDSPRSEPAFGGRSYLVPGLEFSEGVDSNGNGITGGGGNPSAVSRVLGSVDLQKLWKRYQVALDYIGGGVFYTGHQFDNQGRAYQAHTLTGDQRFLWRTGELAVRDCLDYLPEGTFGGGSYGGGNIGQGLGGGQSGGTGVGGMGGCGGGGFGGTSFGQVGFQPRLDNLAVVDVTQELSAKSTVTAAVGYSLSDFLNKPLSQTEFGFNVIDSQQTTAQVGFNRLLTRKDQLSVAYAFEEFHFPFTQSDSIEAHVFNVLYAHRITGKLNFVVGGGPQVLQINTPATTVLLFGIIPIQIPATTMRSISANASAGVGYTFSPRTQMQFSFRRYYTPGSGFLAGALTDSATLTMSHLLGRRWRSLFAAGYSHNSALQNSKNAGINATAYNDWYATASLYRQLSPHFRAFVSYQFQDFAASQCATGATNAVCGQSARQHTGLIGIDWQPRPLRLD